MTKISVLRELKGFLLVRKRYWMAPVILMLVLFGALLVFAETSAAAPFIYTIF